MSSSRVVWALALADFRERSRRYSFLVTLLFTIFVGYAAATGQISMRLGAYRGLYTSAWVGTMMSLIITTFLSLAGFYIVKGSVERDRHTGVGQILASTALSRTAYLAGKFVSNFLVLGSMVAVLALAAITMQFLVAEDRAFHPWALLSPFLLLSLPAMAFTAALVVLFEALPWLRGGFGNVAWFFLWGLIAALPFALDIPRCDPFGVWTVFRVMVPAARSSIPDYKGGFSLTIADTAVRVSPAFRWAGIAWSAEEIFLRLVWVVVALLLVALAALFFDRFDPARSHGHSAIQQKPQEVLRTQATPTLPAETTAGANVHLTPLPRNIHTSAFKRIFLAELRLALKGCRWWWYAVAIGLFVAQVVSPLELSRGTLLAVAWIWPVLIWSALGTRESHFGTQQLIFACPRILLRQLPAAWLASVLITVTLGAGTALRLALAGQWTAVFAWAAGALFVPSLALALGVWTGTSRFFEGLYTALWYIGPLNHVPGIDFSGAARGTLASHSAWFYLIAAVALVALSYVRRARQLRIS